jgi:3',5'-cyclic AMP phosphodiesterase CpdA
MDGFGKRYPNLTGRRPKGYIERGWVGGRRIVQRFHDHVVSDTHYGTDQNLDDSGTPSDPIERLIMALNPMPGRSSLGGAIERPKMVFNLGDCIHHNTDTITRFAQDYRADGQGHIGFPCYVMDGNHDEQFVRDHIIAQQGSLYWGVKIKDVWFQAMRDNMTNAPTQAQIEGEVTASLATRPPGEKTVILHHRALTAPWPGGYADEWDAGALTALEALSNSKNTLFHLHGHNHYTYEYNWDTTGIRMYSPGSITQSPMPAPPYATTYPEGILVIRFKKTEVDLADYNFGYDVNRNWAPGTWNWTDTVAI